DGPPRIHMGFSCLLPAELRSGLHHDIIILPPDRKGFRDVRPLHQLAPRANRYRILPDAKPRRVAPRFAGADVELPAVPRAFHHLAGPGIAVLPRHRPFDETGLNAVGEAAAAG